MRKFTGDTLLVATHNTGKLEEIAHLLAPLGIAVTSAKEHGLPEPEETGYHLRGKRTPQGACRGKGDGTGCLG